MTEQFYSAHGAPSSKSTGVPGWETVAEERELIKLAKAVPVNGVIVEIGGEWGRSAAQFAKHAPDGVQVFTVDLFPDNYHDMRLSLLEMHRHNLQVAGVLHRTTQIKGRSDLMAKEWRGGEIDLLFIDGGHGYQQVKKDIEAWIPFVKPGGVVAFHDYAKHSAVHYLHHQVKMAVDEWYIDGTVFDATEDIIGSWQRTNGPDSLVWYTLLVSLEQVFDDAEDVVMSYPSGEIVGHVVDRELFPEATREQVDKLISDGVERGDIISPDDLLVTQQTRIKGEWITDDFQHYAENATIDELKAYGESHGVKLGRYSKRESIIAKLQKEGLL